MASFVCSTFVVNPKPKSMKRLSMPRKRSFAAVLLGTLFLQPIASGQATYFLTASVRQYPSMVGPSGYDLYVALSSFGIGGEVVSLLGPDGIVAQSITTTHFRLASNLSLEALNRAASGRWAFTERRGSEVFQHYFDLPQLTLDSFPATPTIESPSNGEVVSTDFLLDWSSPYTLTELAEYEVGYQLSGQLIGGVRTRGFGRVDDTVFLVPLDFPPGVTEAGLTMRAGIGQTEQLTVVPLTLGADATFSVSSFKIEAMSLPVNVTARVPEPSALAGIVVMFICFSERRRVGGVRCKS